MIKYTKNKKSCRTTKTILIMSKKAICKHCIHPCKKSPAPECDKFESFSIAKAIKERKQLLASKDNPERPKP